MRRVPELDAVRGLAAALILAYHLDDRAMFFGWAGVNLFFVLSGYLITAIILGKAGGPAFLLNFYARRGLRIWPAYYLALAAVAAAALACPGPDGAGAGLAGLPYYLLFLQNVPHYWGGPAPAFPRAFVHTWTLAVEEQFYLLWPALVVGLGRRAVAPMCLACLALAALARARGFDEYLLLTNCDGFACGGLLALALDDPGRRRGRPLRAALAAGSVIFGLWSALTNLKLRGGSAAVRRALGLSEAAWGASAETGVNLLFLCVVGLLVIHSGAATLRPLRGRILTGLGLISYGVYLYHYPVFLLLDAQAPRLGLGPGWALAITKVALSVGLAALSWRYLERPALALKFRFEYRPGAATGEGL